MEDQKVKIIRVLTVSAVIFMLLLLSALIVNLITLAQKSSEQKRLELELAQLNQIIQQNEEEINYKDTDEYIEKFARDYQNMKRKDEEIFIGKNAK